MLRTRLWMGTLLIAVLAAGLWLDEQLGPPFPPRIPPYPCWLVISIVALVGCCRELRQLMRRRGIRTSRWVSYGGVTGVALSNWFAWCGGPAAPFDHLAWVFAALCVANMAMLLREGIIFREPGSAMVTAGAGMLLVFYLGGLSAFLIELRWAKQGLLALAAHVAAAKCGDTGAYFGGRALGRHKLCPWLSPNKTLEGAVSGLIASVLGVLAVVAVGAKLTDGQPALSWLTASVFGITVGALAQVGDLIESLIKRDCQQKDASDLMPGFGGILDVLDSLLFSAPLAFCLWVCLGP